MKTIYVFFNPNRPYWCELTTASPQAQHILQSKRAVFEGPSQKDNFRTYYMWPDNQPLILDTLVYLEASGLEIEFI